ncbi:hypothetical protein [Proteiniphilum sp. UBA5384]|uniref:hypothetical protein n=1 Tax=Proteiniphilum sp. UBA5384 TaxID=1947279 RepID=UPI0025EA6143|nr:hypothetical protein [Proteiniphilum sp. UBA5384]
MVYIHEQVYTDLNLIFTGMLHWEKFELSFHFVERYIDDILAQCYEIENKKYHFLAQYREHKHFGEYVHRYRRNNYTLWYIIYDKDYEGNILVNKIISNHTTPS